MTVENTDWYKYEELASIIYAKLEPQARVKHNDQIWGHLTERLRQVDVSIRTKIAGHEMLIIVEAKDRTRAPDVMVIDGFAQKMKDVSASRGVIVSRKQPTEENIKYAGKFGIDICMAIDVKDHKWNEQIRVPLLLQSKEFEVTPQIAVTLESDAKIGIPNTWCFTKDDGNSSLLISDFILKSLFEMDISEGKSKIDYKKLLKISFGDGGWHGAEISLDVTCRIRRLFRFCTPKEYRALRNFSNGKTQITDLNLELPSLNDKSEWADYSEFEIAKLESFVFADLILTDLGIHAIDIGRPIVHKQKVLYLENNLGPADQ